MNPICIRAFGVGLLGLLGSVVCGCLTANVSLPVDASAVADADTDGGVDDTDRNGGTLMLTSCGYSVTTRAGASMPRVGSPVLGPTPKPIFVHLGLGGDPSHSVAALWRTADDSTLASTVQYGEGTKTDQTFEGVTFLYDTPPRDAVRMHEAHMCGLKPATTYSYRVGGKAADGTESWSDVFQFHTAPDTTANPTASVKIAVLGDTRDTVSVFASTLAQIKKQMPDLMVFSGDAVLIGNIQDMWDQWFMAAGQDVTTSVPMVTAMGNHDVNSVNYFSQVANPGDEENYSFDYGFAHITVLNDSPPGGQTTINTKALPFLDSDLAAATAANKKWKFVTHHRPLYSSANRGDVDNGGNVYLRGIFPPLYDKYNVDMVWNGHDHNYERFKPIRGGTVQNQGSGTIYLIAGSAGATLYPPLMTLDARSDISKQTYCYAIVEVGPTTVKMTAYQPDGTVIDQLPMPLSKP